MLRTEANTYDMFYLENSLSYLNEENKDSQLDKSVDGKPISDEIIKNSKTKGIIGKIGGIGADSNEPTRNNRRYPLELWQNVEKSEYFIEGMANRTLIGEADHPQERLDYSVTEGAVVLTKYEIQNDGKVYTEFDILDTIPGRTVKTYFDAGCKLGVSSRGLGEEIMRDGEKIIDPDTYQFYCFDVVAFPAVKSARMELIESTSPKKQKLINSITSEIKQCKSLDEVCFIESMSQGVNLYLDEIKEAIEIKKSELNDTTSTDNTKTIAKSIIDKIDRKENKTKEDSQLSDLLKAWLGESTTSIKDLFNQLNEECLENENKDETENKNNKIKITGPKNISDEDTPEVVDRNPDDNLEILSELQNEITDKNSNILKLNRQIEQKTTVIKNLLSKVHTQNLILHENSKTINELKLNASKIKILEEEKSSLSNQLNNKIKECDDLFKKYEKLHATNAEFSKMLEKLNTLNDKHVKVNNFLKEEINNLKHDANVLKSTNTKLQESLNSNGIIQTKVKNLMENVSSLENENKSLKSNNNELNNQISNLKENYSKSLDKYIEHTCLKFNIKESTLRRLLGENYTITDIDKVASDLIDNISKMNSLPFDSLIPTQRIVYENVGLESDNTSNEDLDVFKFMVESKNN